MAAFEKFNPVNFSKNITKTISAVGSKIGKAVEVPKSLTDQLNAKTGLNIASPSLAPINENVKGLVSSVKTLVKNPGGVLKSGISSAGAAATNFTKTSFGVASVTVRNSLSQIRGTLNIGIKNCLRNAVSSLLTNISTPNIPFGGINPNINNGVSINGVITSVGAAGTIQLNKKINKYLNAEITLVGSLDAKRKTFSTNITGNLNVLKDVKNTNFYTAQLTSEVNKNINQVCNTLSPRNKKKLSRGGPIVEIVANTATNTIINNLENQIVKSASGFSAKAPTDFFNSVTGLPSSIIDKATGKVKIAAEAVSTKVDSTANTLVSSAASKTAQAYNKIKDAINSNVPKQS